MKIIKKIMCITLVLAAVCSFCACSREQEPYEKVVPVDEKFKAVEAAFDTWFEAGIYTLNKLEIIGDGTWRCTHVTGGSVSEGVIELDESNSLKLIAEDKVAAVVSYSREWDRLEAEVMDTGLWDIQSSVMFFREVDSFSITPISEAQYTPDMLGGVWYPNGDKNADSYLEFKYSVNWALYSVKNGNAQVSEYGYFFQNGNNPALFEAGVFYDNGEHSIEFLDENTLLWDDVTYKK